MPPTLKVQNQTKSCNQSLTTSAATVCYSPQILACLTIGSCIDTFPTWHSSTTLKSINDWVDATFAFKPAPFNIAYNYCASDALLPRHTNAERKSSLLCKIASSNSPVISQNINCGNAPVFAYTTLISGNLPISCKSCLLLVVDIKRDVTHMDLTIGFYW